MQFEFHCGLKIVIDDKVVKMDSGKSLIYEA